VLTQANRGGKSTVRCTLKSPLRPMSYDICHATLWMDGTPP
jgi:hypothetical protein